MSPLLCERVCLFGQALPFGEAEAWLGELVGVSVAAKQVERLCRYFGEAVSEEVAQAGAQIQGQRLYAMVDGSMILTRESGWKEVK